MSKNLITRIQNKHDIESNWKLATNFTPLAGEIIIYDVDSTHTAPRVKIGDGKTKVNDLKFIDVDFDTHEANSNIHITADEKASIATAKTHAASAHAPSNAEKNQNAFSNVVVGSTTIAADTTTDSLTLVAGSNVTITPDATNDKITIAATDTTYSTGTASAAGITKLYTGTGSNTDGTMTQSAITSALSGKEASGAAASALTSAKAYVDEAINTLISCGASDPSTTTTSKFYFKYSTE